MSPLRPTQYVFISLFFHRQGSRDGCKQTKGDDKARGRAGGGGGGTVTGTGQVYDDVDDDQGKGKVYVRFGKRETNVNRDTNLKTPEGIEEGVVK